MFAPVPHQRATKSTQSLKMFSKIVILACALAVANAGLLAPQYTLQTAALTSTSDNIIRSSGNLAQIATQSKTISTPFSTSSKSDIRVSNPAVYAHTAPVAYAAHAAPVAYQSYSAPAAYQTYAAAPAAYQTYAAPAAAYQTYAHAAPVAAAPVAHASPLLGVAYSPAVAVSHMSYSNPIVSYSW